MQILNNISRIFAVDPSELSSGHLYLTQRRFFLNDFQGKVLPLVGLARCEVNSAIEDKCLVYTVKLTAQLSQDIGVEGKRLVYILETVSHERYILGLNRQPFPESTLSTTMPDDPAEKSSYLLTVEYISTSGLLRLY